MELIQYNSEERERNPVTDYSFAHPEAINKVRWINTVIGREQNQIKELFNNVKIPRLIQLSIHEEDIRTRTEEYENYMLLSLHMPFDEESNENIHFVLGKNILYTFQQKEGDPFDAIRERIHTGGGIVRERSADYLLYLLLDAILYSYEQRLELEEEMVIKLNKQLMGHPPKTFSASVEAHKSRIFAIRKDMQPLKEALATMAVSEFKYINRSTRNYYGRLLSSVHDLNDELEYFRQQLEGMGNTYLANLSNRMNEVMKVLAIVSTLFIPITFIAGLYGMNMSIPGLEEPQLFWYVIWSMVVCVVVMLAIFLWKRWY